MNPANYPDLTLTEMLESDEYEDITEDIVDEVSDEVQDAMELMTILGGVVALANMVEDDHITLREYVRLSEYLEEWEDDLEHHTFR